MRTLPFDYAVRNLGRSTTRLLLSVGGSALVVLLLLAASAFVRGMQRSLQATGEPDNVILVGAGSEESIERSEVDSGVAGLVAASIPGIRTRGGAVYLSPEVQLQLLLKARGDQFPARIVPARGITPAAWLVHSSVQISDGRPPVPAADEIIVGAMVGVKMGVPESELQIGKSIIIDKRPFKIVGRFRAPGTVTEAEVWLPATDLKQVTKRTTDSCVIVTLDQTISEFADVAAFVKSRPDLELAATRETAYYARLSSFFAPIQV
ncbi:MAG TPA: ABC transporter permease, partial [Phycisphaerae bacterium]|nr:ABC transporter permease [Phycisphaerae bacterium]